MIALSAIRLISGCPIVTVESPNARQLAASPIPGRQHRSCVVTATENDAGPFAVEVSDARQEAVHAIAVIVSPIGRLAPGGDVIRGDQRGARPTVEDREKLGPVQD